MAVVFLILGLTSSCAGHAEIAMSVSDVIHYGHDGASENTSSIDRLCKDDGNEVKTITIVAPIIPWRMPWANGENLPPLGPQELPRGQYNVPLNIHVISDGPIGFVPVTSHFMLSSDGKIVPEHRLIFYEIELVDSLSCVPLNFKELTAVSDGVLVFVIRDDYIQCGSNIRVIRKIQFFNLYKLYEILGEVIIYVDTEVGECGITVNHHNVEQLLERDLSISDINLLNQQMDAIIVYATVTLTAPSIRVMSMCEAEDIDILYIDPIEWSNEIGFRVDLSAINFAL